MCLLLRQQDYWDNPEHPELGGFNPRLLPTFSLARRGRADDSYWPLLSARFTFCRRWKYRQ